MRSTCVSIPRGVLRGFQVDHGPGLVSGDLTGTPQLRFNTPRGVEGISSEDLVNRSVPRDPRFNTPRGVEGISSKARVFAVAARASHRR